MEAALQQVEHLADQHGASSQPGAVAESLCTARTGAQQLLELAATVLRERANSAEQAQALQARVADLSAQLDSLQASHATAAASAAAQQAPQGSTGPGDEAALAEVARLQAAAQVEAQRSAALEQELHSVRGLLAEAQSVAAAADVTRSLTAAGMPRLQVLELQQQVERLTLELTDMEFSLNEQRAAALAEQQQLCGRLASAEAELGQRQKAAEAVSGELAELRQRCEQLQGGTWRAFRVCFACATVIRPFRV